MKCHICDKTLTEAEIQIAPGGAGFEPCAVCMEIALDAAYCDGFVRPDELDEVETLDPDTHHSLMDSDDYGFRNIIEAPYNE